MTVVKDGERTEYVFRKNVFGDVTHIYKSDIGDAVTLPNLTLAATYKYDAWGNCIVTDVDGSGIGALNPIRYRGYYFDVETGLYYLNARYYDPETGRFISADDTKFLDPNTVNGLNLFAYCNSNPVMRTDGQGTNWWTDFWSSVGNWFKDNWEKIVSVVLIVAGVVCLIVPGAQGASTFLLSAGISSLVSGYANEAAGGSFRAGWIGGLVAGVISAVPGCAALGGMLGNLTTGLVDKYVYGRDISVGELIFTTLLSGIAGAAFGAASINFAFGVSNSSVWYNAAKLGWAVYTSMVNAFRAFLTAFFSGKFSFGGKSE